MPWHVGSSRECPADKPHAVIKDSDGSVAGCHATEADASKQLAALYASESKGRYVMSDLIECRFTPVTVELRVNQDNRKTIGGYAIVYERLSKNLGGFVERVAPDAVGRQRGQDWAPGVVARYMHDDNMLLGTTASGTLRLSVDDTGVAYDVTPPESRADVVELVERGDVRGSSFAFRGWEDEWSTTDQGYPLRTLTSFVMTDVAPVITMAAAYSDATAGLRSLAAKFECDLEEVRTLAAADELRKFFVRTDQKGRAKEPMFGAKARMELLGKEQDPLA